MFKSLIGIKLAYGIFFISIVFWAFFAYFTMHQLISSQEIYAKIINLSGKQRMLSQKTTLIAKRVYESNDELLVAHLKDLTNTMKTDYDFIINNLTTEYIHSKYFDAPNFLDKKIKDYFLKLDEFYNTRDVTVLSDLEKDSFKLLPYLNQIVSAFEKESNNKSEELKKREIIILVGTLLTIIIEFLFIILPAVNKIKNTEGKLRDLNNNLEKIVEKQKELILKEQHEKNKKNKFFFEQSKLLSMGELIENIAHQWRQPLSVIVTAASAIELMHNTNKLTDKKLLKLCSDIENNAENLSLVIDNFRDYVKVKSKKEKFNLKEVIEEFLFTVKDAIKYSKIKVILDLEENIELESYKDELMQCCVSIFNNSKDAFTNSTEENIMIISTKKNDENITITFRDNAGGISKQILNSIFEPYSTTKHKAQGTGLGMYVVYNIIVNGFGGKIKAKNIEFKYKNQNYKGVDIKIKL